VKAPSTSRFKENDFPGIPEETLKIILLREDLKSENMTAEDYGKELLESYMVSDSKIPKDLIEVANSRDKEKWEAAVTVEMEKMKSYEGIEEVSVP
jgi:hypothetical protein